MTTTILNMTLLASVLILVVVVLRALFIHMIPKKTLLVLWGVVLCKLLIPFSIQSQFSFYTLIDRLGKKSTWEESNTILFGDMQVVSNTDNVSTQITQYLPSTFVSPIFVVWMVGLIACALFFIITHLRCRKEYKISLPVENAFVCEWKQSNPTKRVVQIRQSDKISAPLTYGIWKPIVLLPKIIDYTDTDKMKYILTHEFTHIKRFDALTKWLLATALCVHWFNPLVWVMYILANRDIEISCDETVVQTFGEKTKSAYAFALISMEERRSSLTPLFNNFSKNSIEERIKSIMKLKRKSLAGILLATTLIMGTTIVFATNAPASTNDNLESSNIMTITDDGTGQTKTSEDGGENWLSEENYRNIHPSTDVAWWTYDEYKIWLEQEKESLQELIRTGGKYFKDGVWVEWSQESVEEVLKVYEQTLEDIKNGHRVSKTVNGDDSIAMVMNPIQEDNLVVGYEGSIVDENENIVDLGVYSSKEELLIAIKQYYNKQVKDGKMTQIEADKLIKEFE